MADESQESYYMRPIDPAIGRAGATKSLTIGGAAVAAMLVVVTMDSLAGWQLVATCALAGSLPLLGVSAHISLTLHENPWPGKKTERTVRLARRAAKILFVSGSASVYFGYGSLFLSLHWAVFLTFLIASVVAAAVAFLFDLLPSASDNMF